MEEPIKTTKKRRLGRIIKSTLAAAFGVQSRKNLTDDFEHGKPIHYIITGIIFTLIFLMTVIGVVKILLNQPT